MAEQQKRWQRSRSERRLGGVLGGIAQYFDTDPTVIRVVYAVATVFTGFIPGMALYVVLWIVVPAEPKTAASRQEGGQPVDASPPAADERGDQ